MTAHHLKFRNIRQDVQEASKKMREDWGSLTESEQRCRIIDWMCKVAQIYEIPPVNIMFMENTDYYTNRNGRWIYLSKPSAITAWHEFRHHWQACKPDAWSGDAEIDARNWSLSLFHSVAPRTLRRLATADRVIHLDANMQNRAIR
jgi:hypothetical protein